MSKQLFLNNFESQFVASVNASPSTGTPATELDYGILRINTSASGALLDPGADFYILTALKRSGSLETMIEIMKCTHVDNSVGGECRITVQRAQEGTSAHAYVAGDIISLRWTKGSASNLAQNADNLASLASAATARANLGLGNVDNTSDVNKPVSTAQAAADLAALNSAKSYADGLVVGLLDDRGNYNASSNAWPSSGGSGTAGAILKGDLWTISVAGALGGVAVGVGDVIRALVDTPGSTAGNWVITENNLGFVPENSSNKDASGGYPSLVGQALKIWNAAKTFYGTIASTATANRAYTLQDKDGTLAHTSDVHDATGKTTPVDTDEIGLADSAASYATKKLTWANLKATLVTWFASIQITAKAFIPNDTTAPSNGMFLSAANVLGWSTNSVSRLTLNASGDLTATGTVGQTSDERLKTNWRELPENFVERLASVKSGIYDRTDQTQTQVGVSAQSLQVLMPHAVLVDEDGMLSVAYGNAALAACVMLAREVEALKATLAEVKAAL